MQSRSDARRASAGSLTTGRLNAVRAAFKAGVKPSNRKAIWNFAIRCQEDIGDIWRWFGSASDFNGLPDDWRFGFGLRQLNVNTAYTLSGVAILEDQTASTENQDHQIP